MKRLTVGSMKRILWQALPRHVWGVVTGVQYADCGVNLVYVEQVSPPD